MRCFRLDGVRSFARNTRRVARTAVMLVAISSLGSAKGAASWVAAEKRWGTFAKTWLDAAKNAEAQTPRAHLPNYRFDHEWIELKSRLLSKYLSHERAFTDRYQCFVLNEDAQITLLMSGSDQQSPNLCQRLGCRASDFSGFIEELRILAQEGQGAIDAVEIYQSLTSNGNLPLNDLHPQWKATASKERGSWEVRFIYAGPPDVQLMAPPMYHAVVGPNGDISELRLITDWRDFAKTQEVSGKKRVGLSGIEEQRL